MEKDKGVESVERALTVLGCISEGERPQTLHELSQLTGYYKSTILRLIVSLERFGYVRRREDGRYQLGPSAGRLAQSFSDSFDIIPLLKRTVKTLAAESGETASFYIREGDQRVCIARQNSTHAIRHHVEEGDRLPLERGAAGRILLAFAGELGETFDMIRKEGYFVSIGERDPYAAAVSVPVINHHGKLEGALSISGLATRFTQAAVERHRKLLFNAAETIETEMGSPKNNSVLKNAISSNRTPPTSL